MKMLQVNKFYYVMLPFNYSKYGSFNSTLAISLSHMCGTWLKDEVSIVLLCRLCFPQLLLKEREEWLMEQVLQICHNFRLKHAMCSFFLLRCFFLFFC